MRVIRSSRRSFLVGTASLASGLLLPRLARSQLSLDGAWVGYVAPVDGVRNLWIAPVDDLAAARPVTRVTDRPISSFFQWAYTDRHVVFFQERDGDENWRASSVDLRDGTVVPLTP